MEISDSAQKSTDRKGYESRYGKNPNTLKMDYTHSEAHQMAYDFSVYLHKKVQKFPKYEKFTLQKEIRETVDELMDELEVYEKTKVVSHLYAADRLKGKLVRKIRLAHDLKYSAMNSKSYNYCAKELGCLGACIGGLINKAQVEKKKNKITNKNTIWGDC